MSVWHELTPRQQRVARLWVFVLAVLTGLDFIRPAPPARPWWWTVLGVLFVLLLFRAGRRSRRYAELLASLEPRDQRRFGQCVKLLPGLVVLGALVHLGLGDTMPSRIVGFAPLVVFGVLNVLAAGAPMFESDKRELFVPWPFKLPPSVPRTDAPDGSVARPPRGTPGQ